MTIEEIEALRRSKDSAYDIIDRLLYWIERGDDAYLTTERRARDWLAMNAPRHSGYEPNRTTGEEHPTP